MLKAYRDHVAERAALGIPPLPLSATAQSVDLTTSDGGQINAVFSRSIRAHRSMRGQHLLARLVGAQRVRFERIARPREGAGS